MTLTISEDSISGDHTGHTARPAPAHPHQWEVSWLPGRRMDRNSAITAMVIADMAALHDPRPGDRLWPHITTWATVIGLTAPDALARVSQQPGRMDAGKDDAVQSDPEAAG